MKKIITIITILILISTILLLSKNQNKVEAATNSSSDIQLLARAINGEARGEPY